MLDLHEINKEIKMLEECDCTTYSICSKLAILYIIRDHYEDAAMRESSTEHMKTMPTSAKGL